MKFVNIYKKVKNMTTNTTTETEINPNIKVIEGTLIFSEYHAEYYRNTLHNKNSYIVISDDGDGEYIDCLLLNINIFDYYTDIYIKDSFCMSYLKKEFNLFHYNGFLGVHYYGENDKQNLYNFFKKYGNYFIKDFEQYKSHVIEELDDRVFKLHDEILKQIKIRDSLDELFWSKK